MRTLMLSLMAVLAAAVSAAAQTPILPIVDHIHLNVPDQAKAVEWYQKNFGGTPMTEAPDRLMLVSDAISLAGMGDGRTRIGGLEVEVVGLRVTLAGTTTLAGSVIGLDTAVRNLVSSGVSLPLAVAAASRNPLAMLGMTDRGRIEAGQRADLVELDDQLRVRRVMRAGAWFSVA